MLKKINRNGAASYGDHSATNLVLQRAKEALIGYAVIFPDTRCSVCNAATPPQPEPHQGPGYLPCPDIKKNGSAEGSCALNGPSHWTIGYLPFETLELEELRDPSGSRLWYATSDAYRNFATTEPLNSGTPGELSVDGAGDVVAVIFAPGAPLAGQNRPSGANDETTPIAEQIGHYLEGRNGQIPNQHFVTTLGGALGPGGEYDGDGRLIFNDRLVTITRGELMEGFVERRIINECRALETLPEWFAGNGWDAYIDPDSCEYPAPAEEEGE